ncbi:MAG: metallophosphoesterase [Polyangiaceae bacterium]
MSGAPRRVDVPPDDAPLPAEAYRYEPGRTREPSAARRQRIEVRRFAGPAAFVGKLDHLRVVHLTDLHFGRVTPMAVQYEALQLTNAAKPDLVVITGDFVCHSQLYLDQLVEVLRQIEAPTMGVLGNHDHWSGADEVRGALKRADVQLLDNAHTVITLRGRQCRCWVWTTLTPGTPAATTPCAACARTCPRSACRTSPRRPMRSGSTTCRWCCPATPTPGRSPSRASTS